MIQRVLSVVLVSGLVVATLGATIADNEIESRQLKIHSSEELIDSIMSDCFNGDTFKCLKGRVLCYLDTNLGVAEKSARAFEDDNVDRAIFDRVGRILSTSEFRMALPETLFGQTILTYRADEGVNFLVPTQRARNGDLKEKLLIPILLLMKLKQKIVLPIVLGLIHLKAVKAWVMSKLAITLVLGFLLHNLLKKKGLLPMPMAMMPMPPPEPAPVYGAPAPTPAAPASSYGPSSWEPTSGGPYSRIWEPSSDSQQMAYSAYYPGSSSSSSISSSSSSSGSVGSSISSHAY